MSIVALKRKTAAQYNNNSVGFKNFSINSISRNQGYVGQDSRSRSLIKTPMVGPTPKGHGGCCGQYRVSIVVPSGINYFEDNTRIKSSVLSNYGSIATHYRWIGRPQPFTTVKPDTNLSLNNSQGAHIQNVERACINCTNTINANSTAIPGTADDNATVVNNPYIYKYKNYQRRALCPAITKDVGPLDQSTFILELDSACVNSTVTNIPYGVQKAPFPGFTVSA
jgi:hypothetical protein